MPFLWLEKLITILKWKEKYGQVIREQVVDNTAYQAIRTWNPTEKEFENVVINLLKSELDLAKSNSETNENFIKTEILTKLNNIVIEFTTQFLKSHFTEKMDQPYILTLYCSFFALLKVTNLTNFTQIT